MFTDYRILDRVRVTPRDGGEPYEANVLGNVGGHLVVVRPGERHGEHVNYERAELIEANPDWPLERRDGGRL